MLGTLLLTGATGAVGQPLLESLSRCDGVERIYALTRQPTSGLAHPKIEFLRGDITAGDQLELGSEGKRVSREVTAILHAAAETRFATPLETARRVNVEGTRHLLAFAARCPQLERFAALSTIYVAGRRTGTIFETELEHGAGFVNAYEQSKHECERLLREHMSVLPIAVYRLSTVFGNSRDGSVVKLAAIHHALRFCYQSLAPMLPAAPGSTVDLIALDYAVEAITHLFCERFEPGKSHHICAAADAMLVPELLDLTRDCFLTSRPVWRKRAIEMPALADLATFELFAQSVEEIGDHMLLACMGVVKPFAPQLAYPKRFDDSDCQRALANSGLERPALREFFPRVLRGLLENNWKSGTPAELEAAIA